MTRIEISVLKPDAALRAFADTFCRRPTMKSSSAPVFVMRLDFGGSLTLAARLQRSVTPLAAERPRLHSHAERERKDHMPPRSADMNRATITGTGQVTIPKEVRQRLGLRADSRVEFMVVSDHVEMRVVTPPPGISQSGFGLLKSRRTAVPTDSDVASLLRPEHDE